MITPRLDNLSEEPSWRGCIDAFTGAMFRGWVLSTDNLLKPVNLDVYLLGVLVGRTSTHLSRGDIAKTVGLPIKSGFQFSIHSISTEKASEVLSEVKRRAGSPLSLKAVITIKIADTEVELPFSSKLKKALIDVSQLGASLDAAIGTKIKNEYIAIRDQLLQSTTFEPELGAADVRVIAYYLPQFHPVPENNEWWGPGFTEWTNVVSAKRYLPDHHQPRIPADLGFYDLRIESVQLEQIALAKQYLVTGFCYYYYWFSGKTLMTMPIDRHLEMGYDFDFCLCWANENWSRRWDGSENDVLMAQRHVAEDDISFIRSCIKYFRSPRYIKIDGAPFLQVYRVSLLENPSETIERWREIVRSEGFPGLHVSMVEFGDLQNPFDYGCDSSSQFMPHGCDVEERTADFEGVDPSFRGKIYDYSDFVRAEIARPPVSHIQFRGAMPSWDNTSRKGVAGNIIHGATPALFELWMSHLVNFTRQNLPEGLRFIFITAWNEWAEGAHLEPDRKLGHKNLQAVRTSQMDDRRVLAQLAYSADGSPLLDETSAVWQLVDKLMNANSQLANLVRLRHGKRDRSREWLPTFVVVDEEIIQVSDAPATSRAWIEGFNGRPSLDIKQIILSEKGGIDIRGWVYCPSVRIPDTLPLFISLKSEHEGSRRRRLAMIWNRESRQDVVDALKLSADYVRCGFTSSVSLRGVPAGRYELEILVPDQVRLKSAVAVPANISLVVG